MPQLLPELLGQGQMGWFFPLALLLFGPLVYAANRLFVRRERTLRGVFFLNVLLCAAFLAAYLGLETWKGPAHLIFAVLFTAWVVGNGGWLALNPIGLPGALVYVDASIVTLVIFTAYTAFSGVELIWNIPALCGFAAAILSVTACRGGEHLSGKSLVLLAGAFGAIFLVMWLLVGVAAAPAGEGLVALWNLVTGAVQFVLDLAYRLLMAIVSLFPDPEPSTGVPLWDASGNFALEEQSAGEGNPIVALVMIVLQVAALVVLAIWVLAQMGKIKLGKKPVGAPKPSEGRERPSLWRGLRTLVASWAEFVRLRLFLWKNRRTPKGLYFFLVHRCRMGPWHKRPGETPREFLLRLAQSAQDQPELAAALEELARDVDEALYSGRAGKKSVEQAGLISRQIKTAVRRQFVRDTLEKWLPKPSESNENA